MKDGERERPIDNYGKKEQKEWLDNTLPDPHPCTAGITARFPAADAALALAGGDLSVLGPREA